MGGPAPLPQIPRAQWDQVTPLQALVLQLRNPGPQAQRLLWQVVSKPASPWELAVRWQTLCVTLTYLFGYATSYRNGSVSEDRQALQFRTLSKDVYRCVGSGRLPLPTVGYPFLPHHNLGE